MTDDYAAYVTRHRRLRILQILSGLRSYECNAVVLAGVLEEHGHHPSRSMIDTDVDWLAEQQLVTVRELSGLRIATLTQRGLDVAQGRAFVTGIERPGPED